MTPLAAYLLLFVAVGVGFIFVHLVAGKLIRPSKPNAEKKTIYECGEPTIGSAWIQFDLRFYVVALLFVIFDVEVAFFFPWAEVFGRANAVATTARPDSDAGWDHYREKVGGLASATDIEKLKQMTPQQFEETQIAARSLAWFALLDILVFFGVLLVGFAYLWKRGDLNWVRSTAAEQPAVADTEIPALRPPQEALVGAGTKELVH